jgi:hypothetical protein
MSKLQRKLPTRNASKHLCLALPSQACRLEIGETAGWKPVGNLRYSKVEPVENCAGREGFYAQLVQAGNLSRLRISVERKRWPC